MKSLKSFKKEAGIVLFSVIILISLAFSGCVSNGNTIRESNIVDEDSRASLFTSWRGQSFIVGCNGPSEDFYITSVRLAFQSRIGEPGNVLLEIRSMVSEGKPSDVALTSGSANLNYVTTSQDFNEYDWVDIPVTPVKLVNGEHYCFILKKTSEGTARFKNTATTNYCTGSDVRTFVQNTDGTWSNYGSGYGYMFTIWGYTA